MDEIDICHPKRKKEIFLKNAKRLLPNGPSYSRLGSPHLDYKWPTWLQGPIFDEHLFYMLYAASMDGIESLTLDQIIDWYSPLAETVGIYTATKPERMKKTDIDLSKLYSLYANEDFVFIFSLNFFKLKQPGLTEPVLLFVYTVYELKRKQIVGLIIQPFTANEQIGPLDWPMFFLAKLWENLSINPARAYFLHPQSSNDPNTIEMLQTSLLIIYGIISKKINSLLLPPFGSVADVFVFGYPSEHNPSMIDTTYHGPAKEHDFSFSLRTQFAGQTINYRADNRNSNRTFHYDISIGATKYLNHAPLEVSEIQSICTSYDGFAQLLSMGADVTKLKITGLGAIRDKFQEIIKLRAVQSKRSDSLLFGYPHGEGRCIFENFEELGRNLDEYNVNLNGALKPMNPKQKIDLLSEIMEREGKLSIYLDGQLKLFPQHKSDPEAFVEKTQRDIITYIQKDIEWAKSLNSKPQCLSKDLKFYLHAGGFVLILAAVLFLTLHMVNSLKIA